MKAAQAHNSNESVQHGLASRVSRPFFQGNTRSEKPFFVSASVQPKLQIGSLDDKYEQQADRIADFAIKTPSPAIQLHEDYDEDETVRMKCSECEMEDNLQLKTQNGRHGGYAPSGISRQIESTTGGSKLPDNINGEMMHKFGADFSGVGIHTGSGAARLNQSLRARAFTYGNQIFFNSGEYNPATTSGKWLLAHELAHVMQQGENTKRIQRNENEESAPVQYITFSANHIYIARAFISTMRELRPELFENQSIHVLVYIEGEGAVIFNADGDSVDENFNVSINVAPGNYRIGWSTQGDFVSLIDDEGNSSIANSHWLYTWFWNFFEIRPDFLVIPGPGNNLGTGTDFGISNEEVIEPERIRLPAWAREAYRNIQGQLQQLETNPSDNPEVAVNLPDRVVPWVSQRGSYLNVWYDQAVEPIRMNEDESSGELLQRVADTVNRIKNERSAENSTRIIDGADQTGFQPSNTGADGDETSASRVSEGPQLSDEELYSADSIANALAYDSVIVNYGLADSENTDTAMANHPSGIAVAGASNRLSMELDYSIAGGRMIDQVAARLQHIRYYWEIIDVTGLSPDDGTQQIENNPDERGEAIHPLSGELMTFRRDMDAIAEDTFADIDEAINDPYLMVNWPSHAAYLQLVGLSNGVRVVGSIVSSYINLLTTPSNEINVGWDQPGDYIIRCVASPVYEEDAQVRRASSVAALAVRVVNINERAAQMVQHEENRLEQLRQQLADAETEDERTYYARLIGEAERIRNQDTIARISEQVNQVNQQRGALRELTRFKQSGSENIATLSPEARLLNAQLEISGASIDSLRSHMDEQYRILTRMLNFARSHRRGMNQAYRPRVVLVSEETGQVYQLIMMLGESTRSEEGSRHYKLIDVSSPNTQDLYEGRSNKPGIEGHNEALHNAFVNFRERNEYGRGTIAIQLPDDIPEGLNIVSTMRSAPGSTDRALRRLQDLAVVAEVAALVISGPVGIAVGLAGGAAGAIVAGARIHRRSRADRFDWDFATFMDISAIVGGAVPLLGVTTRRAGRFVYYAGIAQIGQSVLVIPIQLEQQLRAIEMNSALSPGERAAQRAEAFLQAIRSGIITTISVSQMMQQAPPERHTRRPERRESESSTTVESGRSLETVAPDRLIAQNREQPGDTVETNTSREQIRSSDTPEIIRLPDSNGRPQLDPVARELVQHRDRITAQLEALTDPTSPEATRLRLELADINEAMQGLRESEYGNVSDERLAELDRNAMQLIEHLRWMDDSAPEGWRTWELDPMPDTTVMQAPEPTDAGSARRMYDNTIQADPLREAAIYRNTESGELIIVQGEETTVGVGNNEPPRGGGNQQRWKEILGQDRDVGEWELLSHYHPLDPASGLTIPIRNLLPSGSSGDFGVLITESIRAGDSYRTSRIDYRMPDGTMEYTQFSFVPGTENPLVVELPEPGSGVRRRFSFASLEAYHEWANNWQGGHVDLGPVNPTLSGEVQRVRTQSAPGSNNVSNTATGENNSQSRVQVNTEVTQTLVPEAPGPRRERPSARAERLAREQSMAHFISVRRGGPESPLYFGRHGQTFNSILSTLRNKKSELSDIGLQHVLPQLNGDILNLTVDHFIIDNTNLMQHLGQIIEGLRRNPGGARQSEGWAYIKDNILGGDDALLNYVLTGNFSSSSSRGMGTRTVGARQPDFIEFDLANRVVHVTDWTTGIIGENSPHNFKTRFYVEVMKSLLGPDGPAVTGRDVRIQLDDSGQALNPDRTQSGPLIE
jgi:hypothetical protein